MRKEKVCNCKTISFSFLELPILEYFIMLNVSFEFILESVFIPQVSKLWNILALDGSNWQRIDLFEFQRDVEVII
jgi:hypothetical protein